jgi:transposase
MDGHSSTASGGPFNQAACCDEGPLPQHDSEDAAREVAAADHHKKTNSKLEGFKKYLRDRFLACGLSSVRLVEEIRKMGFTGSIRTVRRFVSSLDVQRSHKLKTVRFETPLGRHRPIGPAAAASLTLSAQ